MKLRLEKQRCEKYRMPTSLISLPLPNFEKTRLSFIKYLFSSFPGAYNVENLTREISKIDPSRFQPVTNNQFNCI